MKINEIKIADGINIEIWSGTFYKGVFTCENLQRCEFDASMTL